MRVPKSLCLFALIFLGVASCAMSAMAQSPLLIDQNRADRAPTPPPVPEAPLRAPQQAIGNIAPFVLRAVRLQGTSVAPVYLEAAAQRFIGRTVDGAVLREIAAAVSHTYEARSDVALYTVVIPQQDFSNGVLIISLVEGHVENVDIRGDVDGDLSIVKAYAAKLTKDLPLRRSIFERSVALVHDIPGQTTNVKLLAGGAPGAVRIGIEQKKKRYGLALSVNNSGTRLLGRTQLQAEGTLYDLLQQGDQTRLTFAAPTQFDRYQYMALSHSRYLGYNGTTGSASIGYLRTQPSTPPLRGEAITWQVGVSHPFIRGTKENLYAGLSFDGINTNNALLGQLLTNERIRTLRVPVSYSLTSDVDQLSLSASLNFGIDFLGAETMSTLLAQPAFAKFVAQAAYVRIIADEFVVRARAAGQYGAHRLPTSEFFTLGGADFGHAFAGSSALGDSGVGIAVELGWRPPAALLPDFFEGSEIYVGADGGEAWYRRRFIFAGLEQSLYSTGGGLRLALGEKTMLQLEAANALSTNVLGLRTGIWRFNFAVTSKL